MALLERLELDANVLYWVRRVLMEDEPASLRRNFLIDYARFSRGQERARRPGTIVPFFGPSLHTGVVYELTILSGIFSQICPERV
jgi:hypothetical protein